MKKVVVIKGQMLHDAGRIGDPVTVGNLWGTSLVPTPESARTLDKIAYTRKGRGYVGSPGQPELVDVLFFAQGGDLPFEGMEKGDIIEVVGELSERFVDVNGKILATMEAWEVSRE